MRVRRETQEKVGEKNFPLTCRPPRPDRLSDTLNLYQRVLCFNLGHDTACPEFPQSLEANAAIVPGLDQDRFLPNSFQFILNQSSFQYAQYTPAIEKLVKYPFPPNEVTWD
jgi:hypothetical protein